MLFNSIHFAIFLPLVFILYWFVTNKKLKTQNFLLLVSSYYFYACWDWRFLFLLAFSTLLDYFTSLKIENATLQQHKKIWFWISVSVNLGFLGVFKYFDFFTTSFAELFENLGIHLDPWTINILPPVGISFYTFHGLSYLIDVYKKRIGPERNFVEYAVFVSYFPLLVAGPIERATHLLPQIKAARVFNYSKAVDGMRQILWGLFKKVVIADQCAEYVDVIFEHPNHFGGSTLALGAIFFAIQIYGDFSGYSDIALGVSRLFGIELLRNFSFPYFSRDIAEFWRRWHISLSSWFRDYLYIPLGGSKGSLKQQIKNILIIFIVSGFWHGAKWTFIIWGALHAMYFLPLLLLHKNRKNMEIVAAGKILPSFSELIRMVWTFSLVCFAWIFFRADSLTHALDYMDGIFSSSLFTVPWYPEKNLSFIILPVVVLFFAIEWRGREQQYAIANFLQNRHFTLRWAFYYTILLLLLIFAGSEKQFIYFQF